MTNPNERYLGDHFGDSVYARIEDGEVILRMDRGFEEHYVHLDNQLLESFLSFVAKSFGCDDCGRKLEVKNDKSE